MPNSKDRLKLSDLQKAALSFHMESVHSRAVAAEREKYGADNIGYAANNPREFIADKMRLFDLRSTEEIAADIAVMEKKYIDHLKETLGKDCNIELAAQIRVRRNTNMTPHEWEEMLSSHGVTTTAHRSFTDIITSARNIPDVETFESIFDISHKPREPRRVTVIPAAAPRNTSFLFNALEARKGEIKWPPVR